MKFEIPAEVASFPDIIFPGLHFPGPYLYFWRPSDSGEGDNDSGSQHFLCENMIPWWFPALIYFRPLFTQPLFSFWATLDSDGTWPALNIRPLFFPALIFASGLYWDSGWGIPIVHPDGNLLLGDSYWESYQGFLIGIPIGGFPLGFPLGILLGIFHWGTYWESYRGLPIGDPIGGFL